MFIKRQLVCKNDYQIIAKKKKRKKFLNLNNLKVKVHQLDAPLKRNIVIRKNEKISRFQKRQKI